MSAAVKSTNTSGAAGTVTRTAGVDASAPPAIQVTGLRKGFGAGEVLRGIDVVVRPGTVVALLGPSGCGKTTLLRTIAGLERPDAGEVRLGDRLLSGPGTHVPPEKRRVGMVFQDWALFPHMTVAQNVGYGLPRGERRGRRVDDVLEMVGLGGLGERSPATLSGGQQQRVALARALAPRPGVLLLDEPFSNLDTALRTQVRTEVHQLLGELAITTVFVTHDQEEAFVLGDEVAVMQGGQIVQQASPAELYARPATSWVASFVGDANLVPGEVHGDQARTAVGVVPLEAVGHGPGASAPSPRPADVGGAGDAGAAGDRVGRERERVEVLLRPEELRIEAPSNGGPGGVPATVELHEYYGHDTVYLVRPEEGEPVHVRAGSAPRFRRGDRVLLRYAGPPAIAFAASVDEGSDPNGRAAADDRSLAASTEGNGRGDAAATEPAVANPA